MQTEYRFWTENEKEILEKGIEAHTSKLGKINWVAVSAMLSGRTPNQCKSFHQNLLRAEQWRQAVNFKWARDDVMKLAVGILMYGKDAATIQRTIFPNLRQPQISARMYQVEKSLARMEAALSGEENENGVQLLADFREFCQRSCGEDLEARLLSSYIEAYLSRFEGATCIEKLE